MHTAAVRTRVIVRVVRPTIASSPVADPASRHVPARPAPARTGATPPGPGRPVRHLAVLGDSTAVGLGDPRPGGGWRGFGPLLRDAVTDPDRPDPVRLDNHARTGARMAATRHEQVPAAAAARPDVVVLCAGMNDTLRSDFDPEEIRRDCAEALDLLGRAGATVLLVRFHDHTRVFRLPAVMRRALTARILALNAALDDAVAAAAPSVTVGMLDLETTSPYDPAAWSVDRLHPSELGHRLLARGLAELLAAEGWAVPGTVSLDAAGGRVVRSWERGAWLVGKGVPWLCRRGRDLGPVMVRGLAEGMRRGAPARARPCAHRRHNRPRKLPIRSTACSSCGSAVAYEQRMCPSPEGPNTVPGTTATDSSRSSRSANVSASSPDARIDGKA